MGHSKGTIFNFPNFLSITRILLCFPLIYFLNRVPAQLHYHDFNLYYTELILIFAIIVLMIITDVLDGFIARLLNKVTDFGKLIDPVADKISILIVIIYLTQKQGIDGLLILIYFVVLWSRDLMIASIGLFLMNKHKLRFDSIKSGKWFLGFSSLMFLAFIYDPILIKFSYLKWYLYSISMVLMIYSFFEYYSRYSKLFKNEEYN